MKKIKSKILILIPIIALFGFYIFSSFSTQEEEIIGDWISENDSLYKISFLENGVRNDYYESVLVETFNYSISLSCNQNSNFDTSYLRTVDSDNDIYCLEILGINHNNNQKMSLMDLDTGKILLFNKQ